MNFLWAQQAEMMHSLADIVVMVTGAGFGKSKVLSDKAIKNISEMDNWHLGRQEATSDRLKFVYGAPSAKYLTARSIPSVRGTCDVIEQQIGRRIRATTGRNNDGFFGGPSGTCRQEFVNACDLYYYPLADASSAVAVDLAGMFFEEVTMLDHPDIWFRAQQRVRDRRAKRLQMVAVGTPEDGHWIKDKLIDPLTGEPFEGVQVIHASAIDNPVLPDSYFRAMGQQAPRDYIESQVSGNWAKGNSGLRFDGIFDPKVHIRKMGRASMRGEFQFDIGWDPGYATGNINIMYYHQRFRQWWVYDEVVIQGMTTLQACHELKRRGYGKHNIRMIGIDAAATQNKSSMAQGGLNDAKIIKQELGVRPKMTSAKSPSNADIRVRLNAIATLLENDALIINKKLEPAGKDSLGTVNSIRNFRLKKLEDGDVTTFLDKPTATTDKKWKHAIDAMHYILLLQSKPMYARLMSRLRFEERQKRTRRREYR